jgi:ketosteroid isomerase-like protein
MSRIEPAVRAAAQYCEAFNRHDVAGILRLLSEDCVLEDYGPAPDGGLHSGREAAEAFWRGLFRASPDLRLEVEELLGLGPHCVLRWRRVWTEPDGAKRQLRGADIIKAKSGLICEWLSYAKGRG